MNINEVIMADCKYNNLLEKLFNDMWLMESKLKIMCVYLFMRNYKHARRFVQLFVGLYMLIYLGLICNENMQIEGFWYYLFTGVFEAATIHYAVAKIFGPLIFGRGWCGYACWTAMVLDFLPYKVPQSPRKPIGWMRYAAFCISFVFVAALFLCQVGNIERIMFWAFIIGNLLRLLWQR